MPTKTEQLRMELERELIAVKGNQNICKDNIHAMEQNLIHWETREEKILDQLAGLDGNDLVKQEKIFDELLEETEIDLGVNEQGETVH